MNPSRFQVVVFVASMVVITGFIALLWWLLRPQPQLTGPAPNSSYRDQAIRASGLAVPDPRRTPGDVLTTDTRKICTPGYTQTVRNVPARLKKQVYQEYGILNPKPGTYEIDHLISLELGGSNSIRNLWPQSYISKPLNARVKDTLENKLNKLVCSGKLPIQTAQKAIAQDWVKAYEQYVGPLPR